MKNENIRKIINVDKTNYVPIYTFKQEDDGLLKLALYKNSTEFDITGQTVKMGAKRPNNSIVELTDGFKINKNELDITLKNNILAVPGTVECDLEIIDASGKMTTASFYLSVSQKMTGENNLNASNDISAINKLVEDIKKKGKDIDTVINDVKPKSDKLMSDIKKDYDSLHKIIIDENQAANLQDQVNQTNAHLETIVDKTNVKLNAKIKGMNIFFRSYSSIDSLKNDLDDCVRVGINTIFFPTYGIWDGTNFSHDLTDEQINTVLNECKNRGLKVIFKPHSSLNAGITVNTVDEKKAFLDGWIIFLDKYLSLALANNHEYFNAWNEFHTMTNVTELESYFINIFNKVKSKGLKVGASFTSSEVKKIKLNINFDYVGVNFYPPLSKKGYDVDINDCYSKAYNDFIIIRDYTNRFYQNSQIWITEAGCSRNVDSLTSPSSWEFSTQEQSLIPQQIFYKTILEVVKLEELKIQAVTFWSTDIRTKINSYTPFGNLVCEEIINNYKVGE